MNSLRSIMNVSKYQKVILMMITSYPDLGAVVYYSIYPSFYAYRDNIYQIR
jgi:hypothetical protein